ncbi:MAG TPA: hypothetical protein V6D04_08520, partial [Candidatus Obscuribacterales bacterium]
ASASSITPVAEPLNTPKDAPREELHTSAYMKGGGVEEGLEESISFNSLGEGQGRGKASFPQPSTLTPAIEHDDLSDVIVGIQIQVRRLGWTVEQVHQFIAHNFCGKRRSQLTDDELVCLLYCLRTQALL